MKKTLISLTIVLTVLAMPVLALFVVKTFRVEPVPLSPIVVEKEEEKPIIKKEEEPKQPKIEKKEPTPSKEFMDGYNDASQGKMIGIIKWIANSEYRAGHALGTHDKKNNIKRYTEK
jgi:hypothetical protein